MKQTHSCDSYSHSADQEIHCAKVHCRVRKRKKYHSEVKE